MDMLRPKEHALLAACALAMAASGTTAQPTPPAGESYDYMAGSQSQQPPQQDVQVSTTMIALLAGAVAVFVFIALSIVYLRHCTGYHYAADRGSAALPAAVDASTFLSRRWQLRQRGTTTTRGGLDKEVVEAFPTMRYAEAKALRVGNNKGPDQALECAVCLSEFEDEERLRLLPRCSHAFHPDCIGSWLASHVTCPVCRCNLDPAKDPGSDDEPGLIALPPPAAAAEANNSHSASSEIAAVVVRRGNDDDVAIDVAASLEEEETEQRRKEEALELQRIGTQQRRAMRPRSKKARLVRSHSTGHDSLAVASAAAGRDDMERFTLRLPEHVRREMMAAASSYDQLTTTRRGQKSGGGVSSRRGAARWPSFFACTTRTWSGRLPVFLPISRRTTEESSDGGDHVSSSSSSSSRIRGKRVAAVDVVDGGAFSVGAADSVAIDVDRKATGRQVRT